MTKQEYMLATIMEEAGEIIQACGKILRFGQEHTWKKEGGRLTKDVLTSEITDLLAAIDMLDQVRAEAEEDPVFPEFFEAQEQINKKHKKYIKDMKDRGLE